MKQVAQFNDANLLASLTYTTKAQQPFEIGYDYTNGGNILKETIQGKPTTYEYDGNNQLTKETFLNGDVNSYQYDEVGNRKAAHVNGKDFTFSYNDANQIEMKNDTAYQYDADGNLLQDEHFKYTYNEAQRLTSVQTLKGEVVASYTYDENGLSLTKTVGDTAHEYFYNDEVLDMEVVKKNSEVTQYRYYEWNGYTPLGMIVKAKNDAGNFETEAYQFITNHRGDVLSIRDGKDKEVGSYSYDAYGNVLSAEGDVAKDNPIRYAGYYYDDETKNYYLQARYYNPENGAFLALDSHPGDDDEPLSQNGYTYANNNPLNNIDPNGNFAYAVVGVTFYAIPGWGWAALGVVAVVTAGIWVAKHLSKRRYHFTIPKRLLRPDDTVNLGRFKVKVKGKTAYRDPETGWEIDKDKTGHGGRKWKLKNKKGDRKASLDGKGKILSK